jgi:DHA2 family multidrug resistance protein-like MFS transporter
MIAMAAVLDAARSTLAGAFEAARGLPGDAGAALTAAARDAFVMAFGVVAVVAGAVAFAAAVAARTLLPRAVR